MFNITLGRLDDAERHALDAERLLQDARDTSAAFAPLVVAAARDDATASRRYILPSGG